MKPPPHERLSAGLMGLTSIKVQPLIDLAAAAIGPATPASQAADYRHRLVDVAIRQRVLELTVFRTLTAAARTGVPGPESSTLKLFWSMLGTEQVNLAVDLLGAAGMLAGPHAPLDGEVVDAWSFAPSFHIGGGNDEVQRTVIAEHVLGLPREPKA